MFFLAGPTIQRRRLQGFFWAVRSSAQFSGEFERIARFGYAGVNVAANLLMFGGIYMIFLDLTYAS